MKRTIIPGFIALVIFTSCEKDFPIEDPVDNDPYNLQQFVGSWGSCAVQTSFPVPIYLDIQSVYNDFGEIKPEFDISIRSEHTHDSINDIIESSWYMKEDKLWIVYSGSTNSSLEKAKYVPKGMSMYGLTFAFAIRHYRK